jgi:peptide/nickel transport system substrate-binding protein
MSVTFRLWENAKWWDGEPVTADDVVFSLDRMAQEGVPRPRVKNVAPYYRDSEAIGPHTVKVNTKDPNPPAFIPMLGIGYMTIHPKHVLEGKPEDYFATQDNIVAAGAYKYVSYEPGVKLEFRKNQDYFKEGLPFLDGVDTFIIKGKDRMVAALETEQVLVTKIFGVFTRKDGPTVEPRLNKIGRVVWWSPEMLSSLYHMNWTKPPFDDPKVRRAMYLATDRKHLIDVVELGTAVMPTPFFPGSAWASSDEEISTWPGFRYVDAAGTPFTGNPIGTPGLVKDPRDLEEARALMAEAGYADGFKTTAVATQQAADEEVALVLKEDLLKIGVDIDIQVRPDFASSIAAEQGGDYEIIVLGHGPNIIDPDDLFLGLYLAGGPRNPLKYEDPRIRELFETQKVEPDPAKRQALILEAEEIVRQGEGHIVLNFWSGRVAWVVNNKVKNWFPSKTIQYGFGTHHLWLEE